MTLTLYHKILVKEGLVDDIDPKTSESFARICAELERQDELVDELKDNIAEIDEYIAKMKRGEQV